MVETLTVTSLFLQKVMVFDPIFLGKRTILISDSNSSDLPYFFSYCLSKRRLLCEEEGSNHNMLHYFISQ